MALLIKLMDYVMAKNKPRALRLYDVLKTVIAYSEAGASRCTAPDIARVLELKGTTSILQWLLALEDAEYITKTYHRCTFRRFSYFYAPTRLGRQKYREAHYLGALFLDSTLDN